MSLVGGMDAVEDGLDIPLDDRERGPELVTHVGEEPAPLLFASLETCAHGVEGASERAHFARAAYGDARREVARLDPPGGPDEVAERRRERAQRTQDGADEEETAGERKDHEPLAAGARQLQRLQHRADRESDDADEQDERDGGEERDAAHEAP